MRHALANIITALLGHWDLSIRALILLMVLDYFTGIMAAWHEKHLDSILWVRLFIGKLLIFVVVAVAVQVDGAIGQDLFRALAIWFYLANEALSIFENARRYGVPIPESLKIALEHLKKKSSCRQISDSVD